MRTDANILSLCARIRAAASRAGLLSVLAAAIGLSGIATSCIYDNLVIPGEEDYGTSQLSLSIQLTSTGTFYSYETGGKWENYIDFAGGDYGIYFFTNDPGKDGNDTFIAEFNPTVLTETDGNDYTWYYMRGDVPDVLATYFTFKIMILANWGAGNYPTLDSGTTIDNVCTSDSWGTYSYKTDFELGEGNLIPFYGIQEYKDVEFSAGNVTDLEDPINMLRAMAKIEVVLNNSDIELESVVLHNYNATGCCAPKEIYSNYDYVEDGTTWYYKEDGLPVHLYGDANDTDEKELPFAVTTNDDGKIVWYCYAPEYANTTATGETADDYAYIQLNLYGYTDAQLENFRIYFRDYDEDGLADAGADYDIGRNVLYRFTVDFTEEWLQVHVDKWEDSFQNNFTFGDTVSDD